ncbi:outer membrane OprD family porin [Acinetobacter calcoaceticus]|uniref:Outer membrane OprD family porin n=1 Tax=Acinetobacter calcoaceticus TaxID=471 RepID=A0A4R1XWD6_ACICA|nr:outer membrane OprD family porin [Acinetobacter calcoaceticus]
MQDLKNTFKLIATLSPLLFILVKSNVAHADFLQDSSSSIQLRNFYQDRHYENDARPSMGSWSQGITGRFQSGYTDTPLQVGVDVMGQYALRLNDLHAGNKNNILPYDEASKTQYRDYGKMGLTLKLKYQDSELKIGELEPKLPVIYMDDTRQLSTIFAGALFENKSVDNLKITAGYINRVNSRYDDRYRKLGLRANTWDNRITSDGLAFIGLDHKWTPNVSTAYWYAELADIYRQHYANLAYNTSFGDTKLKVDAQYFNNSEAGAALEGKIDNQSIGLLSTIQHNSHTLTTGIKKNEGPSSFPLLVGNVPQRVLHGWSNLGFTKPNERTFHMQYRYDFKELGVDGLTASIRYLRGDKIHRSGLKDNKENETISALRYLVPEGRFKNLGLEYLHIDTDIKYGKRYEPGNKFSEDRIVVSYLYKF